MKELEKKNLSVVSSDQNHLAFLHVTNTYRLDGNYRGTYSVLEAQFTDKILLLAREERNVKQKRAQKKISALKCPN